MNRARVLLLCVMILSLLGMTCIAIAIGTNSWLFIEEVISPIAGSLQVGLWKTCSKNNFANECIDLLISTPVILIFIGLGLLVLGFVTTTVAFIFKRLLPFIALVPVTFFLMSVAFLTAFVAVYWFQMLDTLFKPDLTNTIIVTPVFSIGYSCILLFVGLGMVIITTSIACFAAGSLFLVRTTTSDRRHPVVPSVVQQSAYF